MGTIRYTKTAFNKPMPIGFEQYKKFKDEIDSNPSFEIVPEGETFSEHFSGFFMWIGISVVGCPLLAMMADACGKNSTLSIILVIPCVILFFVGFMTVFQLFLEGPSFARYKKQKRNYFNKMKLAISKSSSYSEFYDMFYK